MSQVYVSMAMSPDGFITGPHDDAQNPAGINGMRLDLVRTLQAPATLHLRYQVVKG